MKSVIFENSYIIYEDGRIFSLKTNKYLKKSLNKSTGYYCVRLNGKGFMLHRIILHTFNPRGEKEKYLQVSHIDNDKSNNSLSNLEWATPEENVRKYFKDKANGLYDNFNPRENLNDTKNKYLKRKDVRERIAKSKREKYWNDEKTREKTKESARLYYQRKDVKEKIKLYNKEYRKEYNKRPEVIARTKEYRKEYNKRPEVMQKNRERARIWNEKVRQIKKGGK